jgi:hypothetical protein
MKTHQLKHRIELISGQLRDIQLSLQRQLDATDARFETLRGLFEQLGERFDALQGQVGALPRDLAEALRGR